MNTLRPSLLLCLVAASSATAAHAQTSPWTLRAGPAWVNFSPGIDAVVGGEKVPGAKATLKNNTTVAVEIGYAIDDRWTARLALGAPPSTTLGADGSLKALTPPLTGRLGHVKYGPAVLSATYRFLDAGPIRPYVGAGINYTLVLSSPDGDLGQLDAKNAWGKVLQAGFDVPLGPQWSVFLDVRKVWVKTTATGVITALGGAPARAEVTLDPLITHVGVSYRF